ncbi:MAG: hypothetical protein KJ050_10620 [Candidatus Omnitrophica bacterium]|nr:hypothetical protein [Candidatus Omnitrophota bacterium]
MATTFKQLANNAAGYLNSGIDNDDTSLNLESGQGSNFPATGSFWVTVFSQDPGNGCEIILVGGRSGDVLTGLTRGQQGTTAASWSTGAAVQLLLTKQHLEDIHTAVNAIETALDLGQTVSDLVSFTPTKTAVITINGVAYRISLEPV